MTGRKDLLKNLQTVSPYIVSLPNDTGAMALEKGHIQLGHNFIIRNVLFIPELKCNLLSFGQLLDESDPSITLSNGSFAVQDPILMMLIGVAEWGNGIFIYQSLNLSYVFTGSV